MSTVVERVLVAWVVAVWPLLLCFLHSNLKVMPHVVVYDLIGITVLKLPQADIL